jgi:hypothetical protein
MTTLSLRRGCIWMGSSPREKGRLAALPVVAIDRSDIDRSA